MYAPSLVVGAVVNDGLRRLPVLGLYPRHADDLGFTRLALHHLELLLEARDHHARLEERLVCVGVGCERLVYLMRGECVATTTPDSKNDSSALANVDVL